MNQQQITTQVKVDGAKFRREVRDLTARSGAANRIVGGSLAINQLRQTLDRVAPTNSRVLISGPAGCGKELVARLIHARSPRSDAGFVAVNAAGMAPDMVEEELFGVEEGGDLVRTGLLEQAHGGTLFLHEIADMPIATQAQPRVASAVMTRTAPETSARPRD